MLDLKPVSIPRRINPRISNSPLKQIPIAQPKLLDIKPQRHRQRQTTLPCSPIPYRLRRDIQIVRCYRHVLSKPEREAHSDPLINRTTDITTKAQRPEHVEVDVLRHRLRELNIAPDLIVCMIDNMC